MVPPDAQSQLTLLPLEPNPSGLCQCGCGQQVPLAKRTDCTYGTIKGQPLRFCPGHHIGKVQTGHAKRGQKTRTYNTWRGMLDRVSKTDPTSHAGKYYASRGTTVCDRWRTFAYFLADMGERPEGMSLDRIDPYGNYEPGNCRWATQKQQVANRRANPRDEKLGTHGALAVRVAGLTTTLSQAAIGEMFGVSQGTVSFVLRGKTWTRTALGNRA